MTKLSKVLTICCVAVFLATPALAQEAVGSGTAIANLEGLEAADAASAIARTGGWLGGSTGAGAIGAGIVLIGAGLGIGFIGSSAVASQARQPEVAGNIQTAMIISAALIEGATFFALIICLQAAA